MYFADTKERQFYEGLKIFHTELIKYGKIQGIYVTNISVKISKGILECNHSEYLLSTQI